MIIHGGMHADQRTFKPTLGLDSIQWFVSITYHTQTYVSWLEAVVAAAISPPATDTNSSSGCDCDHRDHGRDATTLTLSHLSKAIVAIYHYYYKQNLVHGNKFRNGLLHHHRYHQKQAAVSVVIYCYDKWTGSKIESNGRIKLFNDLFQ